MRLAIVVGHNSAPPRRGAPRYRGKRVRLERAARAPIARIEADMIANTAAPTSGRLK